jgi:hypothetical protein
MLPPSFCSWWPGSEELPKEQENKKGIDGQLDQLARAHMQSVPGDEIEYADDAKNEDPGHDECVLRVGVAPIVNFSLHADPPSNRPDQKTEDDQRCAGHSREYEANDRQGVQLALSARISLLNRVQKRPPQGFRKTLVAALPIRGKKTHARFLRSNEFLGRHQSTTVALTAWFESSPNTN